MKLNASIKVAVASCLLAGLQVLTSLPAAAAGRETLDRGPVPVSEATAQADRHVPSPARPSWLPLTGPTVTVTPTSGPAFQPVTVSVVVSADARGGTGVVTIRDGSTVLVDGLGLDGGAVSITTNALGPGPHLLTAELSAITGAPGSTSGPARASYGDSGDDGDVQGGDGAATAGTVVVTIPSGALSITSPYSAGRPLDLGRADVDQSTSTFAAGARIDDIVVTDTRAGNQGFTASVSSSRFVGPDGDSFAASRAGFVDVAAEQVPGNAMRASDVRVVDTRPGGPGLGSPRVFARYPAGVSFGTVHVHGTLAVAGVPSSARAGRYRATLTFTAI